MNVRFVFIGLCVICHHQSRGTVWKWKQTLDADDPRNFVLTEQSEDCHGFYFPEFKDICMMSLYKLRTNQIFLPRNGDVYLKEGADIVFDRTSANCIKVKPQSYKEWLDPNSWTSQTSNNLAVPHLRRTPSCRCDEAILPNNSLFAVTLPSFSIFIKSVEYGLFLEDLSCPLFLINGFIFPKDSICEDELFCQSQTMESNILNEMCPILAKTEDEEWCSEGVDLIGHCSKFCGVVIQIGDKLNVEPHRLLEFLDNESEFDWYYSEATKDDKVVLQISLTDKKAYSGNSVLKVEENLLRIKDLARDLGIFDMKIFTSGPPKAKGRITHHFLVIFGTLAFVLLAFGAIFGIYEKNLLTFRYDYAQRFNLSRYNQALRRSVIFSRFDNTENVSIAGSVLSLERDEFSNPLYEEQKTEENVPETATSETQQ